MTEQEIRKVINALNMQVKKKPLNMQGFPRWGYCPNCGKTVTKSSSYVGCTWCLQALDWREDEAKE